MRGNASPEALAYLGTAAAAAGEFQAMRGQKNGILDEIKRAGVELLADSPLGLAYVMANKNRERLFTDADMPLRATLTGVNAIADAASGKGLREIGQNAQGMIGEDSFLATDAAGTAVEDYIRSKAGNSPFLHGMAGLAGSATRWVPQILSPL